MKKTLKKVASIIPYLMLLASFILIIQVAVSIKKGDSPTLFGRAVFVVVSPSMEDTIMVGDMIFVDTTPNKLTVGDIISFKQPGQENIIITHRIIEVKEIDGTKYYSTLGDNNFESFDWELDFPEINIVGKYVSKSEFLGGIYVYLFSNGLNVLFIAIILVFVTIGGMELYTIIKTINMSKNKDMLEEKEKLIQEELERLRQQKQEKDK